MKRRVTDEERALFEQDFREARPIRAKPKPGPVKKIATGPHQLDGNTEEKLKRGRVQPGARIDLHGLTQTGAHDALLSFLAGAQARGVKLALVVTGKGNPSRGEEAGWMRAPHGVLKDMVPRWLREKEFAALAAGVRVAHIRHGGEGALYVYLRKAR